MSFDITKCKPFDLERALAGDSVVTIKGVPVTEIHYLKTLPDGFPVVAVIEGSVFRLTTEGRSLYGVDKDFLLMSPKTKKFEAWVSVYPTGIGGVTWTNEDDAKMGLTCIKAIKIETEIEI